MTFALTTKRAMASVLALALAAGAALAEEDYETPTEDDGWIVIDDGWTDEELKALEESGAFEGGDAGDGEWIDDTTWVDEDGNVWVVDDTVYDDPGIYVDDGEWVYVDGEIVLTDEDGNVIDPTVWDGEAIPDLDCGGCEYAFPTAMPTMEPRSQIARETSNARYDAIEGNAPPMRSEPQRNICFDADLYVAALCDWQRPFFGDQMP